MKDLFGDEIFPHTRARPSDPITSHVAYEHIKLRDIQKIVLERLRRAHPLGMTHLELEDLCNDHGSTFRTRCAELVDLLLVEDSKRKKLIARPRKPPRWRVVWVLTPLGEKIAKLLAAET